MNKADARAVYEQYWLHARHVELEMWLFNSFYAVLVGGVAAVLSADIQGITIAIKVIVAVLAFVISLLGFLLTYSLRIPFLKFILLAELIAINELGLKESYRRFFKKGKKNFPGDKRIDIHDILSSLYALFAGLMAYVATSLYFNDFLHNWALILGTAISTTLLYSHFGYIRPKIYIKGIADAMAQQVKK